MPTPVVIDLSHYNTVPESLIPATTAGIIGVIHKATEGSGWEDDKVGARFYLAKQAKMLWGVYHFLRPGDMVKQAEFFIRQSAEYTDRNSIFAADHEDHKVSLANLKLFLETVAQLTGRVPVVYSGHVLKEQLNKTPAPWVYQYPLWLAQYSDKPELPKGYSEYWLWQYTDDGEVPGIKPPTDLNAISLSLDEFTETWPERTGPKPEPEPVPEDEVVTTIKITSKGPVKIEILD